MPKARLIDVSKCTACRGCQVACKQWNELPAVATTNTGTYENPPKLDAYTFTKIHFTEVEYNGKFHAHFYIHLRHEFHQPGKVSGHDTSLPVLRAAVGSADIGEFVRCAVLIHVSTDKGAGISLGA